MEVVSEDGSVTTEEEEYTAVVPVSLYQVYANLEAQLGRTITEDDKSNINHIYSMIAEPQAAASTAASSSAVTEAVSSWTFPSSQIPPPRMPPTS